MIDWQFNLDLPRFTMFQFCIFRVVTIPNGQKAVAAHIFNPSGIAPVCFLKAADEVYSDSVFLSEFHSTITKLASSTFENNMQFGLYTTVYN